MFITFHDGKEDSRFSVQTARPSPVSKGVGGVQGMNNLRGGHGGETSGQGQEAKEASETRAEAEKVAGSLG
nr:MAG: hypothetical protein AM324_12470 [Candidatus Thorarchaeota archaeon SMTZ1-83]